MSVGEQIERQNRTSLTYLCTIYSNEISEHKYLIYAIKVLNILFNSKLVTRLFLSGVLNELCLLFSIMLDIQICIIISSI